NQKRVCAKLACTGNSGLVFKIVSGRLLERESSKRAKAIIVGCSKNSLRESVFENTCRILLSARVALSECPPKWKKLSSSETTSTLSCSTKILCSFCCVSFSKVTLKCEE